MAWLRIDAEHKEVLDFLVTSSRVSSPAGRAETGPFAELRQAVIYAAAVGYAAGKAQDVQRVDGQIRDTLMFDVRGGVELGFALAYSDSEWDLDLVLADDGWFLRLRALERYTAGGLQLIRDEFDRNTNSVSAIELMMLVHHKVEAARPRFVPESGEVSGNPLIAALRRRGQKA